MNLTASGGTLGRTNLTTVKGRTRTNITSDQVGTALITASSAGLNPGSTYLTVKQVPINLIFEQWLYNEDDELTASFSTTQDIEYSVSFRGNGTKFSVPFVGTWWANASIYIDMAKAGEDMIDSEAIFDKEFPGIALAAGNHTMKVKLTKDISIPLWWDTNIYVERITLS